MDLQITSFEDGIQRIVREIVARQGKETPIVCIQGDPNAGKTELNNNLHARLNKDSLIGFSGKIGDVARYHWEIENEITAITDPRFYLIEDLVSPATFVSIYRQFTRLPDIGIQITREIPCIDTIQRELDYFHKAMEKTCPTVKQPAFDLIVHNPEARDKRVRTYGRR